MTLTPKKPDMAKKEMPETSANKELINRIYNLHREYIKHEDNLINHRVTWGITVQSFVIATFGFCYQKKYEVAAKIATDSIAVEKMRTEIFDFYVFLVALTVIGISTAILNLFSVLAAVNSVALIGRNRERHFQDKSEYSRLLPAVIGGGHPDSGPKGQWLAFSLPVFFLCFWISIDIFLFLSGTGVTFRIYGST